MGPLFHWAYRNGLVFRYRKPLLFRLMYKSCYTSSSHIFNVLTAEQDLREHVQREDRLYHHVIALRKATAIEANGSRLKEAQKQLEKAQRLYPKKEYCLYQRESLLESNTKADYDKLKRDDTWFMREGLVQDCSRRGGCCSRQCGCCAQRHHSSQRNRGQGHCTVECGCCMSFRGYDLPVTEKKEMRKLFVDALDKDCSEYLLNLANLFFRPVRPQSSSKKKYWWQKMFRSGFSDGKVL